MVQRCFVVHVTFVSFRKVKPWSQDWLIAYPGFCSIKRLEVFLLPLDGMLVHCRSLPCNLLGFPQLFASTHLYTWVERSTVRVKCLAQEHSTMSPARAQTQTTRFGVDRTNHEATTPPQKNLTCFMNCHPCAGAMLIFSVLFQF